MTTTTQASAPGNTNPTRIGTASIIVATMTLITALVLSVGLPNASAQLPQVDQAELNHIDPTAKLDPQDYETPEDPPDRLLSVESGQVNPGAIDSLNAPDICGALLRAYRDALAAGDRLAQQTARIQYRHHGCEHYVGFIPL